MDRTRARDLNFVAELRRVSISFDLFRSTVAVMVPRLPQSERITGSEGSQKFSPVIGRNSTEFRNGRAVINQFLRALHLAA